MIAAEVAPGGAGEPAAEAARPRVTGRFEIPRGPRFQCCMAGCEASRSTAGEVLEPLRPWTGRPGDRPGEVHLMTEPTPTPEHLTDLAAKARDAMAGVVLAVENQAAEIRRLRGEVAAWIDKYDDLQEAAPGLTSILTQMRNIESYCRPTGSTTRPSGPGTSDEISLARHPLAACLLGWAIGGCAHSSPPPTDSGAVLTETSDKIAAAMAHNETMGRKIQDAPQSPVVEIKPTVELQAVALAEGKAASRPRRRGIRGARGKVKRPGRREGQRQI
jgi:hypothetical protein